MTYGLQKISQQKSRNGEVLNLICALCPLFLYFIFPFKVRISHDSCASKILGLFLMTDSQQITKELDTPCLLEHLQLFKEL
jgi:hypothetical protein